MTTNPIAGNQFFSSIENMAGQLNNLNASDATVANLNVDTATVGLLNQGNVFGRTLNQALAYTPTNFVGKVAGSFTWLNNAPGEAEAAAGANPLPKQLFQLPVGAQIVRATLFAPSGALTATSVDLGVQLTPTPLPAASYQAGLATSMLAATVIAGGSVGDLALSSNFGTAGVALTAEAWSESVTAGLTLTNAGGGPIGAGESVTVLVEYLT